MFFDAHFHYAVCCNRNIYSAPLNWCGLSCAHSIQEWNIQSSAGKNVFKAFGIHPQLVGELGTEQILEYKQFMEALAAASKLDAIGEAGFDLFTDKFKSSKELQEDIWQFELDIAEKYNIPLVVHCRKANDKLFAYSAKLKKIPAVLFHSFMGSYIEASSLIKRNINCFFSFGKQMMNNNKKVIECVKNLPVENLLLETDAPFQTLKGEENTIPNDIISIYNEAWNIRCNRHDSCSDMDKQISNGQFNNFCNSIFNNGKQLISGIQ